MLYYSLIMLCAFFSRSCSLPSRYLLRSSKRVSITRFLTTNILCVGKKQGTEEFISMGIEEYEKRLSSTLQLRTFFYKDDKELVDALLVQKTFKGPIIAMDEKGEQYTSRGFSDLLYKSFEDGGSRVTFVIGGFAGLPPEIRSSFKLISLSKMTWTHQMARLLLIEQIYRGAEIRKNSKYHKD